MSQSPAKPKARQMPASTAAAPPPPAIAPLGRGEAFHRIDGEHGAELDSSSIVSTESQVAEIVRALPELPPAEAAPTFSSAATETHLKDLAFQLTLRSRDLDQRESRFHRQLMLLDQEQKTARLVISEKEAALEARLIALGKREKEVADQFRRAATAEEALRQEFLSVREHLDAQKRALARDTELHSREQERMRSQSVSLQSAERKLDSQRTALLEETAALRQSLHLERQQFDQNNREVLAAIEQKQVQLEESAQRIAAQKRTLAQTDRAALEASRTAMNRAEAEFQRLSTDLEAQLREVARQKAAQEGDAKEERRRLLLERETQQLELRRGRSELAQRQAKIEDAQAALQKTQSELLDQQRSMLEERLAVEQTMQALGRLAPQHSAAAIQSARQKLAEHYRWMKESLVTQKKDLLEIARQLEGREQALAEDRESLQDWAETQQAELDAQLLQIEAQRQQLHRREAEAQERELHWALQKRDLEARLAIQLALQQSKAA